METVKCKLRLMATSGWREYSLTSGDALGSPAYRAEVRISHRGDAIPHTGLPLMLEFPRQPRARVAF